MHLTMTLDELLATSDKSRTHRMVEQGTQAQATEQTHTPARRVPMHLTMTLEELLATSDKSRTHRMVDPVQTSMTEQVHRQGIETIFDMMPDVDCTETDMMFDIIREVDVKVADALGDSSATQQIELQWAPATQHSSRHRVAAEISVAQQQ